MFFVVFVQIVLSVANDFALLPVVKCILYFMLHLIGSFTLKFARIRPVNCHYGILRSCKSRVVYKFVRHLDFCVVSQLSFECACPLVM